MYRAEAEHSGLAGGGGLDGGKKTLGDVALGTEAVDRHQQSSVGEPVQHRTGFLFVQFQPASNAIVGVVIATRELSYGP